jgi:hypothetical protein
MALIRFPVISLHLLVLSISPHITFAEPVAISRHSPSTGSLYIYLTDGITIFAFESISPEVRFDYSEGLPLLGAEPVAAATREVFFFANANGFAAGFFELGRMLPPGLSPKDDLVFTFGSVSTHPLESPIEVFLAEPAAAATYNAVTGELIVDVRPEAQALLFESDGLFNLSASPLLGSLAPAQFDTDNLMFFNDDHPLPTGRFSLGPILPPGLAAADVSLATKGNGIAVDLPVQVVPEGTTAWLAGIGCALLIVPRRRRPGQRGPG